MDLASSAFDVKKLNLARTDVGHVCAQGSCRRDADKGEPKNYVRQPALLTYPFLHPPLATVV